MWKPIRRVGVIGAGTMGSGIAAHLANAGVRTLLLDIVPSTLTDAERKTSAARNRLAATGVDRALKARPPAFYHPSLARLIEVGNTEDDFARLASCDLVIEAIIERLDDKRALFARLEALGGDAIIGSNTSGLPIREMLRGLSPAFQKRFLVTHFFNPVRYMKLLELVAGEHTDPAVVSRVKRFGEDALGKGIVLARDTPNFVANRIGTHALLTAIHEMMAAGLAPEDVDAVTGPAMGHPKSASLRTVDIVGLDTLIHVANNCHAALVDDEERAVFEVPAFIRQMAERGLLGEKTGGGFYHRMRDGNIETFDPISLSYRPRGGDEGIRKAIKGIEGIVDPASRVRALVSGESSASRLAWRILSRSLAYSARRVGQICDDVVAIDEAMRWGYNWELGPFETWDALGFQETAQRMEADGIALPDAVRAMRDAKVPGFYRADGAVYDLRRGSYVERTADPRTRSLTILRRAATPVLSNEGAEAWDLGDGVLGVSFRTKANTLDGSVIALVNQAIERAEREFKALLVANQGENFCTGANIALIASSAEAKDFGAISQIVKSYQDLVQRLRFATVPVVVAPYGMTLGGGLELCFGGALVHAAAETYAGLVEVGVGLIPAGGGTMNMVFSALDALPEGTQVNTLEVVSQVWKTIALARVSTSARDAQALGYLGRDAGVSFDRARLVAEAKARALGLADSGYHPPAPRAFRLPGESGIATMEMMAETMVAGGAASAHDALIAKKLAVVVSGGAGGASKLVTEDEMLELEREAFMSLAGEPRSIDRMRYMLANHRPLRN